jgi:hypothetical protein
MGCTPDHLLSTKEEIEIGKYQFYRGNKIAEGTEGSIWFCKNIHSNKTYALKEVDLRVDVIAGMYEKEVLLLVRIYLVSGNSVSLVSRAPSGCWHRPSRSTGGGRKWVEFCFKWPKVHSSMMLTLTISLRDKFCLL